MAIRIALAGILLAFAANAKTGGISGGGGNVMVSGPPTQLATVGQAKGLILQSRTLLIPYLEKQRQLYFANQPVAPIFRHLFEAQCNVLHVASDVLPMIQETTTCFGQQNVPSDASTFSDQPHTICVSAMSIASKVNVGEIVPQSAALMAHEYSELLGFSEDEAVQLQTLVLADFLSGPSSPRP